MLSSATTFAAAAVGPAAEALAAAAVEVQASVAPLGSSADTAASGVKSGPSRR